MAMERVGVGAIRSQAVKRRETATLATLLLRISAALIRTPHHRLGGAIDGAIAEVGDALGADRALVARREPDGIVQHHLWEHGRRNGSAGPVSSDLLPSILGRLEGGRTLVWESRDEFPLTAWRLESLTEQLESGIVVPLQVGGTRGGMLAVIARAPRPWSADAVEAAERLAEMVAAALDRIANQSAVTREQEGRRSAEAESRVLREHLAHAGRVSMLGELAASLAHELNQPLTAIYTNVQAAERFLDRKRPALGEALGALHDLGQDCRRAGEVLGRLRQMFRRHETERVPLAVGPLIEHVLRLLYEDAVGRGVDVVLDVPRDLPLVNGDRVQLEQVVMNLLVNAFDAVMGMDRPREVTLRAAATDGFLGLSILDTGPGIPPNDLDRIFEPFFTRKPNGMGMGLSICRTIIEAHGGRIGARNGRERGSVFELSLPAVKSQ
ncbi:MAG: GAF domain-containing protein [Chloroflexi bacterium]|nr:MAG: GAF domain-containing protein [Chloroflexota bacterium]